MNCLEPAPKIYRLLIHSIQIVSVPTYILALISLVFIKSKVFTVYRIFLIWYLLENVAFEIYWAYLVEPVLHAPYALIRTTGILSKAGVGGMVQAVILSLGIEFNGVSISEMFWFRYKASTLNYKDHKYTNFLRLLINTTRLIAAFITLFCIVTHNDGLRFQQDYKLELLKLDPLDMFLLCDSVYVMGVVKDYVSTVFVVFWILLSLVIVISVVGTAAYIRFNIPKTASEATWRVQQQLLQSLVVQASIHIFMLGIPVSMFIYAFLFGYENETIAYVAFVFLTYHGFASALAMIIFTKPLRQYLMVLFRLKKTVTSKTSITSVNLNKRASVF